MAQFAEKDIGRRAGEARKKLDAWRGLMQESIDFCFPNRDAISGHERGQRTASENWDGTAPAAVLKFADRMMEFTPPGGEFIVLEPGPFAELVAGQKDLVELRTELRKVAAMCNAAVQSGGFFNAASEMYLDYAVGVGGMIVNEANLLDSSAIARFAAVPLGTFYVEDGPYGTAERRWRWFSLPLNEIGIMWRDAKMPDDWTRKLADGGKPAESPVDLIEVEYFDHDLADSGEPWRYEVYCKPTGSRAHHRMVERTGATTQWLTPRHSKRAGESMGRGPIVAALPDIRTANKTVELVFRAIALNLLGIWMAEDSSVNPNVVKLAPGVVIPVRSAGGPNGPSLARLDTGAFRPDFASLILEDVRTNIKRGLMDAQLPPLEGPVRSATEVAARLRELALDMPGSYGRIIDEFIVPLVQRLIDIMHRRGLLKDKVVVDQLLIKVSVSSPLAREQRMAEVERLVQWVEMVNAIGGRELVMVVAKLEDIPARLAELMGIDPALVNDKKERQAAQQNMAQVVAMSQGGGASPIPAQPAGPALAA